MNTVNSLFAALQQKGKTSSFRHASLWLPALGA
jgi:hypothetical protein